MPEQAKQHPKEAIAAIMPLYNKRNYVLEAIESILRQTRLPDEIVIVDDGSTDGSGDLVKAHCRNNPRIILIRQDNQGPGAARNAAINASSAPLLTFLDADDKWLPERVEKQAGFMEHHPSCMFSFTASIGFNEQTGETWHTPLIEDMPVDVFIKKEYFPQRRYIATNSVMLRRKVLDKVGMFDPTLRTSQDTDLWLRIMLRFGFTYIPEYWVWVRRGYPQTVATMEKRRNGNHHFFLKHRYTFGKGLCGQAVWRAGYASVLRGNAIWYFKQKMGLKAAATLARAVYLWPFFNPSRVSKSMMEYSLGSAGYDKSVAFFRKLIQRKQ